MEHVNYLNTRKKGLVMRKQALYQDNQHIIQFISHVHPFIFILFQLIWFYRNTILHPILVPFAFVGQLYHWREHESVLVDGYSTVITHVCFNSLQERILCQTVSVTWTPWPACWSFTSGALSLLSSLTTATLSCWSVSVRTPLSSYVTSVCVCVQCVCTRIGFTWVSMSALSYFFTLFTCHLVSRFLLNLC